MEREKSYAQEAKTEIARERGRKREIARERDRKGEIEKVTLKM